MQVSPNNPTMTNLTVTIQVQVKDTGEVKSSRKREGGQDLPSGGLVQENHALLVEALRSECYVMMLSKLSLGSDPESITVQSLHGEVLHHLNDAVARLLPEVLVETRRRTLGN
jgi:hypothetical protein